MKANLPAVFASLLLVVHAPTLAAPALLPYPQEIAWNRGTLNATLPRTTHGDADPRLQAALEEVLPTAGASTDSYDLFLGKDAALAGLPQNQSRRLAEQLEGLPPEGYVLWVQPDFIVLAGASDAGTFYAIQTLGQLLADEVELRSVTIRDWPAFTRERGYGEFFYGEPWSHEDRQEAIRFMARTKMNFYMYAPKDDPYHREKWKEPYPPDEMAEMKELRALAERNYITYSWAMSPGLSMMYSNEKDFEILMEKYWVMYDMGVRNFSLQLDDIGNAIKYEEDAAVFGSVAESHAYMMNKVYDALKAKDPAIDYSVCGQVYYVAQPDDYNRTLGKLLKPEIPIMWTGSDVVDNEITIPEVYLFASGIQRQPFVSDNYPVNDFARERLFMGPLVGRPNDLVHHVYPGFLQNPMNQQEASKIGLATIADYAWNPEAYDPERSFENAIRIVVGDEGYAPMRLFCENNRSSVMEKRESIEFSALFLDNLRKPTKKSRAALEDYVDRMVSLPEDLKAHVDNPKLLQEIDPWVVKLQKHGEACKLALQVDEGNATLSERWSRWHALKRKLAETYAIKDQQVGSGVFERLTSRATLGGVGLGIGLATPSSSTDIAQWTSMDAIADGDVNSPFLTDRPVREGDWIQVTLPKKRPVKAVKVLMGNVDHPMEFVYQGVLEYSTNLRSWKPLCESIRPEVEWLSEEPVEMRAVRLRVTGDQDFKAFVREFSVVPADRPQVQSSFLTDSQAASDGSVAAAATADHAHVGDTVKLIFEKPVAASRVVLLVDEDVPLPASVIEYSNDDESWFLVGDTTGACTDLPLPEDLKIKAVRLRITEEKTTPFVIHDLVVLDKDGMAI